MGVEMTDQHLPGASALAPWDDEAEARLRRRIDEKTKPIGALGRIEDLAAQIARTQRRLDPRMETCQLTIFAGDHGIVAEGVSAYPQVVTRQMLLNFLDGNAAANVFARSAGVSVRVVDAGVAGEPVGHPDLLSRRIAPGTRNFAAAPPCAPTSATPPSRPAAPSAPTAPGTPSASARWASATPPPQHSSPIKSSASPSITSSVAAPASTTKPSPASAKSSPAPPPAPPTASRPATRSPNTAASRSR